VLAGTGCHAIGLDIVQSLLNQARRHYRDRVSLLRGDALALPFRSGTVDTVVIFEAIYYFKDIAAFLHECARILRPAGRLLICWANPAHYEFGPGAYTFTYPTAVVMQTLLAEQGFSSILYGGFAVRPAGAGGRLRSVLKRTAGRLGAIPAGMKGKALLKRVFYGNLVQFPAEIVADDSASAPMPVEGPTPASAYRVLYVVAVREG
jgi:SAM-dependent methyltransferase